MANNQPKITFKVFNQEFNKAMTEMNNEGKKFRQELKLEQEQLKMTGSESDKLAADLNGLQKQYDVAQQKTKATADQLEKAKVVFGENSTEVATMETKLRSAEIAEQQLANKIGVTTQKLEEAKIAESSAASESEKRRQKLAQLEAEQDKLSASSDRLTSEYNLQKAEMGANASETDKLAAAEAHLGKQSDITERSIAALEQQLELTKQEYGENSKEAIQMSTKLNVAKTSVSELDNELDQLKDELGGKLDAGNFLEAAEVLSGVGEKLKEVGTSAVETALDIDDSVVKINNSLGLTGKEAERTKEHLLNVFNTGVTDSYEEAGDAIIQVRQSIKDVNNENLDDITYKAMSFSSTFDTDINETVRGAGALMDAFGMDSTKAFDLMFTGASRGLNKSGELADNLAEYATLFQESGYSAEEMFTSLEAGLKAGAYNLDKVNDVLKEAGVRITDGSMAKGAEELGGKFNEMYKKMSKDGKGNNEIFAAMAGEISKIDDEQKKAAATSALFGSLGEDNGFKVIQAMSQANGKIGEISKSYKDVTGNAEKFNESSKKQSWQATLNELGSSLSSIGEDIMKSLQPLIEKISEVAKWFSNLSEPIREVILALGVAITVITALTPIIAAFFIAISAGAAAAGVSMGAFMISMLPIIVIVAAIVVAITAVILIFKNWGAVTEWLGGVWESIKVIATNVWNGIANFFINLWTSISQFFVTIWTTITTFLTTAWQGVVNVATTIWNGLVNVFTFIFLLVKTVIMAQWTIISTALTFAWKALVAIVSFIFKPVIDMFKRIWEGVKTVVMAVWNFLSPWLAAIWNKIKSLASSVFNAVAGVIRNIWNGIKSVTMSVWNTVFGFIVNVWNKIKSAISTAINATKSIISNVWNTIKSVTSSVWNSIKSVISSVWNGIKSAVTGPINTIKSTVSSVWNSIKSITSSTFNAVKNAIMTPINAAKDGIKRAIDAIKGFFSGLKLKFPKIDMPELPKFEIKGKFSLKPPSVPSIGVKWHANGGFFNQASVIGIGEKGPEAAVPLMGKRMDPFADAVGNRIFSNLPSMAENKLAQAGDTNVTINMTNNLYGAADENRLVDKITQGITKNTNTKTTAWGGRA
ncbi:hypothetical protein HCB37_04075 [Listeria booriae]|uniref:phage tail tape measure protein n=1 Tax=Listeria booriae TaxID=1552123 RepID=UPI001628281A|nr:phage tail tape measure protein [Listeria booriae]MBC2263690.1 hypothetical protein [Listeria booriae]